jgi:hypothetical protein
VLNPTLPYVTIATGVAAEATEGVSRHVPPIDRSMNLSGARAKVRTPQVQLGFAPGSPADPVAREVARGFAQPLRPMNARSCVCGPPPAGTRMSSPNIPLARTMSA